ncbi:MAG: tetratricopeptide repeat protein, partial [Gammaproteobacteria bacterium]
TGVLFRRDANYLIVNPIDESNAEEKELQDTSPIKTRIYRWDGQRLLEITSATPELIAEAQKTALAQNVNIANEEAVAARNEGDYATAFYKFRWAAEEGHSAAQNDLGAIYEAGEHVPQDYTEAIKWYRKAADQGDVLAQFNLGKAYEYGNGIQPDDKEAEKWYQRAADQGDRDARQRLYIIRGKNSEWAQRHISGYLGLRDAVKNHPLDICRNFGRLAEQQIRWVQDIMVPSREGFRERYNQEVPFEAAAFKRVEADLERAINKNFGDLVRGANGLCI